MGEEEARALFRALRWHATGGDPVCPTCGCLAVYEYRCRPLWKCKAYNKQFSVTSGTIFHSRKLPMREWKMAIALFVNGVKGKSALELGRDLDVSYKTAYVLAHKLRQAMGADQDKGIAKGSVEVDGAHFGGYVKPANHKENRRDRRKAENQSGKRRVVVAMRERNGRTYPFVVEREDEAVGTIKRRVEKGSTVYADEAPHWAALHAAFETHRINHSEAYSTDDACTNQAESFFSRLGRAEIGQHHHTSGPHPNSHPGA